VSLGRRTHAATLAIRNHALSIAERFSLLELVVESVARDVATPAAELPIGCASAAA
jgi:hypothetical protein